MLPVGYANPQAKIFISQRSCRASGGNVEHKNSGARHHEATDARLRLASSRQAEAGYFQSKNAGVAGVLLLTSRAPLAFTPRCEIHD